MHQDTRRGIRTWLNVANVLVSLGLIGWLIYLLRANANALLFIAILLLFSNIIFVASIGLENGLARLSAKWGNKSFSASGHGVTDEGEPT